jgi:flavodoxin
MKAIIIYYSLDGNTRFLAETISYALYMDKLELRPKEEIPRQGFKKYIWGGKQVFFKEKPDLQHFHLDLDQYTHIFIGTPVWVGTYAPVFNTFFSKIHIAGKKVALFCCHGGGGVAKTFENIKKCIPRNEFIGEIQFQDPSKGYREANAEKVKDWADKMQWK